MGTFDILTDIYNWIAKDIIGNEQITAIGLSLFIMVTLSNIGMPKRYSIVFLIPVALGLITLGFMSWFGWLIISFAGLIFGYYVYTLYQ